MFVAGVRSKTAVRFFCRPFLAAVSRPAGLSNSFRVFPPYRSCSLSPGEKDRPSEKEASERDVFSRTKTITDREGCRGNYLNMRPVSVIAFNRHFLLPLCTVTFLDAGMLRSLNIYMYTDIRHTGHIKTLHTVTVGNRNRL